MVAPVNTGVPRRGETSHRDTGSGAGQGAPLVCSGLAHPEAEMVTGLSCAPPTHYVWQGSGER